MILRISANSPSFDRLGVAAPAQPALVALKEWVRACIAEGIQELDTIVVLAPDEVKAEFDCYESMADAIEFAVAYAWSEMAVSRLRVAH